MLERLIESMLHRRAAVLALVAAILGAGAVALVHLPIDAFPDVTGVQVEVLSTAPGLSAEEIERRLDILQGKTLRL